MSSIVNHRYALPPYFILLKLVLDMVINISITDTSRLHLSNQPSYVLGRVNFHCLIPKMFMHSLMT